MRKIPSLPPELSPSRYIEKVSLATGEVLDADILPRQLLVGNHRDYHPVDVQARRFMSRLMKETGDQQLVTRKMKQVREIGLRTSERIARALGQKDPEKVSKALFGLKRKAYYFRYKRHPLSREEIEARLAAQQHLAARQLAMATGSEGSGLRVLLTGGTGFIGKEILWQAAGDDAIAEVVVLIRPKTIRDKKTGEVIRTLSPAERGRSLLGELRLDGPEQRGKYRFVAGDVEQPDLGIAQEDIEELAPRLTHVIHCAASVAFDDPYEKSFDANVKGTLNALHFSHRLQVSPPAPPQGAQQSAPRSPFVAHLAIETSYIHGRQVKMTAREEEVVFPRNFYNNYYELTKAMASIETERFILEKDLRVVQLCPSIVIGESKTGNNRGDTKVVNAPVNLFGRAAQTLGHDQAGWVDRSKAAVLTRMALVFPGDPSAELNIIPVDRVVAGIVAALRRPEATGRRVHLATDKRLTSAEISQIVTEELDIQVKLADPTTHRTVTLPVLSKMLAGLKQERLAQILERLSDIFGSYSEWGQPIHEVGRDVELLGLDPERPDSRHAFRMLCRHNRWVQEFGKVKDPDEISRRERVWQDFVGRVEEFTGRPCGTLSAEEFRRALELGLDAESFELK